MKSMTRFNDWSHSHPIAFGLFLGVTTFLGGLVGKVVVCFVLQIPILGVQGLFLVLGSTLVGVLVGVFGWWFMKSSWQRNKTY